MSKFVINETLLSTLSITKNKRFAVDSEGNTGLATLGNIKKYRYKLIQDVQISDWNTDGVKNVQVLEHIINALTAMNKIDGY
jgi:hypothetical protein